MVTNFIIFYIAKIVFFTLQSEFLNIFYFQKLKTSKTIVFCHLSVYTSDNYKA